MMVSLLHLKDRNGATLSKVGGILLFKWNDVREDVLKRIHELEVILLQANECESINRKMDEIFNEIKQYLPDDKKHLIIDAEDCFTEELILYEKFFYETGYRDNIGTYKRFLSWLKKF